jgi:hypothetical protein
MSLDDLSLESGDGISQSQEAPQEKSEKQRESSRRATAQLQKTQKDEKKAKTDDDELFLILARFINNPLYEDLIMPIVDTMKDAYPSRFVLSLIALVYPDASYHLLEKTGYMWAKESILHIQRSDHRIIFDENKLHPTQREWITLWLTITERFLTADTSSVILTSKLAHLLSGEMRSTASIAVSAVFRYFFDEKNITIPRETAASYAEFILSQLDTSLRVSLTQRDDDLKIWANIEPYQLFGI